MSTDNIYNVFLLELILQLAKIKTCIVNGSHNSALDSRSESNMFHEVGWYH